jgi:hypothetical protein
VIFASLKPLEAGEEVILQWVVTPAIPVHPPVPNESRSDMVTPRILTNGNRANKDEVTQRRLKLMEPNVFEARYTRSSV